MIGCSSGLSKPRPTSHVSKASWLCSTKHRAVRETQKRAASVFEFRRADKHRPIDVVALAA